MKKEIVKNHLQGLDEEENLRVLAASGKQVDKEALENAIDEFGSESEKKGLDPVAKSYGVGRLAGELGEVARFKRKHEVELADMLRGAKVARVLKEYGVGLPELEQFLSVVYARASEKGYDAETLVQQISDINNLEKRHGMTFDELKVAYDKTATDLKSKQEEKGRIVEEIAGLKNKKSELMAQNEIDERKLREYALTKEGLRSLGLSVNNLETVRNFLLAIKAAKFDPTEVISRLNSIGDLEKEKAKLEQEMNRADAELHGKRAFLREIKKLEETNLSVEQVGNIHRTIVRISSDRGIDTRLAFTQFEEDILNNYDPILGLKPELTRLQESKARIIEEADEIKKQLAEEQAAHSKKVKRLEEEYAKILPEINAYNSLKEIGIDAKTILSWNEIIASSKLDFTTVESQLKNYASLKSLEQEINQKIVASMSEATALKETIESLKQEKLNMESSIKALGETAVAEINSVSSKIHSSLSSLNESAQSTLTRIAAENEKTLGDFQISSQQRIEKAIEDSKESMKATVSQLSSSVADFSTHLKNTLDEATPQIKNVSAALEAGERLGKYRNIMPLLELLDEKKVSETEALIAMWNVASHFSTWVTEHYRSSPKTEISEPLSKLVSSINDEIQRVNQ
ncbi:MAG: hypothetical protein JRN52_00260 [Nitrososphaerota archaeon]|nr:hypothetical protein [Nitrososphaerota archaeon]